MLPDFVLYWSVGRRVWHGRIRVGRHATYKESQRGRDRSARRQFVRQGEFA